MNIFTWHNDKRGNSPFKGKKGINSLFRESLQYKRLKIYVPEIITFDRHLKSRIKNDSLPKISSNTRNSIKIVRNCSHTPTFQSLSPCFITKKLSFTIKSNFNSKLNRKIDKLMESLI